MISVNQALNSYLTAVRLRRGVDEAKRTLALAKMHRSVTETLEAGLTLSYGEYVDLLDIIRPHVNDLDL